MWTRRFMPVLVLVMTGAVLVHCDKTLPQSQSDAEIQANRTELLERAQRLAESELARLSAAEMIYRNKVYDHVYIDEDNGVRTDILMKYYRNFRAVEVVDVKRTESLLYPVEYVIRYDYDLMGTGVEAGLPATMAETAKKVRKDNAFHVYASDSLTREYRCDPTGECGVLDPELLLRPNYWELNSWAKKNGVLQVDDLTVLAES